MYLIIYHSHQHSCGYLLSNNKHWLAFQQVHVHTGHPNKQLMIKFDKLISAQYKKTENIWSDISSIDTVNYKKIKSIVLFHWTP
jgi:hypothetical protein